MTFTHNVTGAEIIKDALLLVQGVSENETVPGAATTIGLRFLNNMVKSAVADTQHVWSREEVTVFGVTSQQSYSLGSASTDDEWAKTEDFISTRLNGAAAAAATTLTVDSTTGMAVDDRIGIELTSGTREWTTIQGIASSTSVQILIPLTGAAADNNTIYTYTARPERPLRILNARRQEFGNSDVPVSIEPLNEYFDQPNKTTKGTMVFVSYKPTLTSGTLYTWQPAGSVKQLMHMTVEYPLADITADGNLDFPVEWNEAFVYGLAVRLEPTYGQLDQGRRQELLMMAGAMWKNVLDFDTDPGSIYLQPNFQ